MSVYINHLIFLKVLSSKKENPEENERANQIFRRKKKKKKKQLRRGNIKNENLVIVSLLSYICFCGCFKSF
jgi:hypothetical protein